MWRQSAHPAHPAHLHTSRVQGWAFRGYHGVSSGFDWPISEASPCSDTSHAVAGPSGPPPVGVMVWLRLFVKGEPTRRNFVHALETMGAYNLGGYTVKFGPGNHNGSNYVDLSIITRSGRIQY